MKPTRILAAIVVAASLSSCGLLFPPKALTPEERVAYEAAQARKMELLKTIMNRRDSGE